MIEIILYVVFVYGFCNIIAFSKITEKPRVFLSEYVPFLYDLVTCMMCLSFWVGLASYFLFEVPIPYLQFFTNNISNALVLGFFTSGCVWLLHTLQERLER